jgi:hypothetical protein
MGSWGIVSELGWQKNLRRRRGLLRCRSGLLNGGLDRAWFAELHRHLKLAVAEGTGSDNLAHVGRGRSVACDDNLAGLPDIQKLTEQERDSTEREVSGKDIKRRARIGSV